MYYGRGQKCPGQRDQSGEIQATVEACVVANLKDALEVCRFGRTSERPMPPGPVNRIQAVVFCTVPQSVFSEGGFCLMWRKCQVKLRIIAAESPNFVHVSGEASLLSDDMRNAASEFCLAGCHIVPSYI